MASTFPTSLDTIPNSPTTEKLGESAPKHSEMHNMLRDAIVAVETRVGITGSTDPASLTYRVSADGEGAAIAALTAKTTPVDADLVGLSDSAAGGVLKKLSWSSIKTALQSVFATLAGIAGGQTLNGGTAASETLTLCSTAHATKGKLLFGTSAYDEINDRLGINKASPEYTLDTNGAACVSSPGFLMRNALGVASWRISGGGTDANNFYISTLTSPERFLLSIDRNGDMGYSSYAIVLRCGTVIRPNTDAAMNDRVSLRVYGGSGITKDLQQWLNTSGTVLSVVDYLGNAGFGTTAPSARVHAISTAEQQRLGYDASNYTSATVDSTGKTTRTGVGTAPNFKWLVSDATTNAVYDLVTFSKNTSGTGANGLGVRMILSAQSSTTADTAQGAIESTWATATHASRKGRLTLSAYDTAIREGIRVEASGTAAMLGFFGVTAVVKPTALTTQLTTLTYTAPTTPDYAIAAVTQTTPFGFTTADEAHTVLSVIKNLQDRVAQLETKLQSLGLLT